MLKTGSLVTAHREHGWVLAVWCRVGKRGDSAGVRLFPSAPSSVFLLVNLSHPPARAMLGLIHRGRQRDTERHCGSLPTLRFQGCFPWRGAQPAAAVHLRPRGRLPAHQPWPDLGSPRSPLGRLPSACSPRSNWTLHFS